MAYNKNLDKAVWEADIVGVNDTLKIAVMAYNGGERKLQIGPRVYEKKNGDNGFRKAGRMTTTEVAEFVTLLPDINTALEG